MQPKNCSYCDNGAHLKNNKWVDMCKNCGREREPTMHNPMDSSELTAFMSGRMLDACTLFNSVLSVIAMPAIYSDESVDACIDLLRKKIASGELDAVAAAKAIDLIRYCRELG